LLIRVDRYRVIADPAQQGFRVPEKGAQWYHFDQKAPE